MVSLAAEIELRPNFVLAMADDQGWGDMGYNGHPVVKTPNFDELARTRGMSLNAIQFPPTPGPTDPLLAFIVFMRETSTWRQPLIDGDPAVPLVRDKPT